MISLENLRPENIKTRYQGLNSYLLLSVNISSCSSFPLRPHGEKNDSMMAGMGGPGRKIGEKGATSASSQASSGYRENSHSPRGGILPPSGMNDPNNKKLSWATGHLSTKNPYDTSGRDHPVVASQECSSGQWRSLICSSLKDKCASQNTGNWQVEENKSFNPKAVHSPDIEKTVPLEPAPVFLQSYSNTWEVDAAFFKVDIRETRNDHLNDNVEKYQRWAQEREREKEKEIERQKEKENIEIENATT